MTGDETEGMRGIHPMGTTEAFESARSLPRAFLASRRGGPLMPVRLAMWARGDSERGELDDGRVRLIKAF